MAVKIEHLRQVLKVAAWTTSGSKLLPPVVAKACELGSLSDSEVATVCGYLIKSGWHVGLFTGQNAGEER